MNPSSSHELASSAFRREREPHWNELRKLLERSEQHGPSSLSAEELVRLAVLHRHVVSSLAVARSISLDRNLVEALSALAARSMLMVYGPRRRLGASLRRFATTTFPVEVRRMAPCVAVAAFVMLLGGVVGFLATLDDMDRYYAFMPEGLGQMRSPSSTTEELREGLFDGGGELGTFATMLFTHNSQVALLAFALGFAAGLPTVLLLLYNGAVLGAFAALFHSRGLSVELWSWLLPHGVPELSALVLAGAGGLSLASHVLFPGEHTRRENLARGGRRAGLVLLGVIGMLAFAALFEGFFRQLVTHVPTRYGVAALSAVAWGAYLVGAGRNAPEEADR